MLQLIGSVVIVVISIVMLVIIWRMEGIGDED